LSINVGSAVGWSPTVTVDDYGNVYLSVLGINAGKSSSIISGSLSRGELDDYFTQAPSRETMIRQLTGHSVSGSLGLGFGFGKSYSAPPFYPPPRGGWATQVGIYSPQVGVGYNYTSHIGNLRDIWNKISRFCP
jgi:hypothetical protein